MDKKNTSKSLCKGFTLLEMLFVIVIIAGLMVAWVVYTQRDSNQKMVDKTVEQMLDLLEASRSYFSSQLYYWPTSFDDLKNEGYLTGVEECSPWQKIDYSISQCNKNTQQAYQLYWSDADTTKAKLFGVVIVVNDEQTANQIAARLPMREVQPKGVAWQVTALTTVPEIAGDLQGKIIKVGTVISNQVHNNTNEQLSDWVIPSGNPNTDAQHGYVKKPNCPDPLAPAIFFLPYDYKLAHSSGGGGAPTRSTDVWCETGVKDPTDPSQLSIGFNSYVATDDGATCGGGASYPAYAMPQYCDYEPSLNYDSTKPIDYSTYWRLNYWACQNKGATIQDGNKASIIYFVTCLDPRTQYPNTKAAFYFPFAPNNKTTSGSYSMNWYANYRTICLKSQYDHPDGQVGCFYPTGCSARSSTQKDAGDHDFTYCPQKRRRCINPSSNASPSLSCKKYGS